MALNLTRIFKGRSPDQLALSGDVDPSTADVAGGEPTGFILPYMEQSNFTGSDEEIGALIAWMQTRGLIDTSTGEVVWADEASAEESNPEVQQLVGWLGANNLIDTSTGEIVWIGNPGTGGGAPDPVASVTDLIIDPLQAQDVFVTEVVGQQPSGVVTEQDIWATPQATQMQDVFVTELKGEVEPLNVSVFGMGGGVDENRVVDGFKSTSGMDTDTESARMAPPQHDGIMVWNGEAVSHGVLDTTPPAGEGIIEKGLDPVEALHNRNELGAKWNGPDLDANKNELESVSLNFDRMKGSLDDGPSTLLAASEPGALRGGLEPVGLKFDNDVTDYAEGGVNGAHDDGDGDLDIDL